MKAGIKIVKARFFYKSMLKYISGFCLLSFLFFAPSCQDGISSNSKNAKEKPDYSALWNEIDSLEKAGSGKTIIDKCDYILQEAKKSGDYESIFKALAIRSKFIHQIEEESTYNILSAFEAEASQANLPLKNILNSALAELYLQYYQQNRWRFQGRTPSNELKEDFRNFSLNELLEKVKEKHILALENSEQIQSIELSRFTEIIAFAGSKVDENHSSNSSYTLYDLLWNRAIDFFKNPPEQDIDFGDQSLNSEALLLGKQEEFLAISSQFEKSKSYRELVVSLYQSKLQFAKRQSLEKLVEADLERLGYFFQKGISQYKDSLYHQRLLEKQDNHPTLGIIQLQLAQLYHQWGQTGTEINKVNYLLKAHHILSQLAKQEQKEIASEAKSLLNQIEYKSLSFQTESTYPTEIKPEIFLQYRNLDSVIIGVYPIDAEDYEAINQLRNEEDKLALISKLEPLYFQTENLSSPYRYEAFNKTIKLKSLPLGQYVILASSTKNPLDKNAGTAFQFIQISNLAYFFRNDSQKGGLEIFTLDRKTGRAVPDVQVNIQEIKHSEERQGQSKTLKSSAEGYVFVPFDKTPKRFHIELSKGKDQLKPLYYGSYYPTRLTQTRKVMDLFTDRAIYRPGQRIYFKGIVYSQGETYSVDSNYVGTLKLYNVNNQEISSFEIATNAFGSFEGSFRIPKTELNGVYSLRSDIGSNTVRVESYKRPSFRVQIDSVQGRYKIGDSIQVRGKLDAYAGQFLSYSKVNYRIYRKIHSPIFFDFRHYFPIYSQEQEIAQGTIKSDAKGVFDFSFLAKEDPNIPEEQDPLVNYIIEITGTSPSGESRTGKKSLLINKKAYQIQSNLDRKCKLEAIQNLRIDCKNNAGSALEAKGKLSLYKLKKPESFNIPKLWDKPSLFKSYPFPSSKSENGLDSLEVDYLISESSIKCNSQLKLFNQLAPGPYLLKFKGSDKAGNDYEHSERFILFDENSSQMAMPEFHFFSLLSPTVEPGEKLVFLLGTSLNHLELLYEIEQSGEILLRKKLKLSREQRRIEFPVSLKNQGGIFLRITGLHSNRTISYLERIDVPQVEKMLDVSLSSYRDKTEPGSLEKWELSIKDKDGKTPPVEVLASMYDASLDQFHSSDWNFNPLYANYFQSPWNFRQIEELGYSRFHGPNFNPKSPDLILQRIPQLNWFGFSLYQHHYRQFDLAADMAMPMAANAEPEIRLSKSLTVSESEKIEEDKKGSSIPSIRKDLRETAFFYPQLKSNKKGIISFEFEMPDALTRWKFRALAHSKDLKFGSLQEEIISQKELMVFPQLPRFFRTSDSLEFTSLISNLGAEEKSGEIVLRFKEGNSAKPIDIIVDREKTKKFLLKAGESKSYSWVLAIPEGLESLIYEIEVVSAEHSDGERGLIPVLPKRILLTESFPLASRAGQTKSYTLNKLAESAASNSLKHKNLVLEYTSNPAWLAVQSLPFISPYKHENSEAVFARFFANRLAMEILEKNPAIEQNYNRWNEEEDFKSNLRKNESIKMTEIEETPFLGNALNEEEKAIALGKFFNSNQINYELEESINKLLEMQLPNGSWPWFKGMRENRYISQYIVAGFGKLHQMKIDQLPYEAIEKAVLYLDREIEEDYKRLLENKVNLANYAISPLQIHYLYTRSFFKDIKGSENKDAFNFFLAKLSEQWTGQKVGLKAMSALVFHRFKKESQEAEKIIHSLEEFALQTEELGMYWKMNRGVYWHESEIQAQCTAIEAFFEIGNKPDLVEELKYYLLKLKETHAWPNSMASTEAVFALLEEGENLLQTQGNSIIQVGEELINSKEEAQQAGSGYFSKSWSVEEIGPKKANVRLINQSNRAGWGAFHWQYEEDISKVKASDDQSLSVDRKTFRKTVGPDGEQLILLKANEQIKVGDEVVVKILIRNNRDLEFVHLKDERAAGLEPMHLNAGPYSQDGLHFYRSTTDFNSHFYFEQLPRGVYEFSYSLRASHSGSFLAGIASIQSMYAPGFASHSQGQKIEILPQ